MIGRTLKIAHATPVAAFDLLDQSEYFAGKQVGFRLPQFFFIGTTRRQNLQEAYVKEDTTARAPRARPLSLCPDPRISR